MSGRSIAVVLQLGFAGAMALPLLARSCDTATTAVRVADGTGQTVSQGRRLERVGEADVVSRAEGTQQSALLQDLLADAPRLAEADLASYLRPTAPTVRFASALPDDGDGFSKVFGHDPTLAMLEDTRGANRNLDALDDASERAGSADDVTRLITESEENVIAVIGHNEDGVMLFPDGSHLEIATLAEMCAAADKRCLILSCESDEYIDAASTSASGISRVLSAADAIYVSRALSGFLGRLRADDQVVSYRDLDVGIRYMASQSSELALSAGQAKRASRIVVAGGGVGAVVFFGRDDD
ncbi:MAG: hypothetical protein AAF919_06980 [Pseudomonadota bacterium]